ncbi:unnamed protein product [Hermetia illucens]|uniref:lysozyme n=1 Tax=Hermetia illucens TaxID=343691 RepID=A0A7R8UXE1_HERIL|nr:lysozyme c-1-like [Hermetia illucens]CAD7088875.1 unnamed protein product [Hermetia illucens]
MKAFAVIAFALVISVAQGTVYSRCGFAQTLYYDYGVTDMNTLANWVCLVQYESSFNDQAVGAINYNGTQDFGLFQINNKYWCQGAVSSSDSCGIACTSLLGNLSASWSCAQLVYQQQGFSAWYGWLNNCNGTAPSVADCF